MAKGGARAISGPPPDPAALRRDKAFDQAGWTTLGGEREGPAPEWPFDEPSEWELRFWAREWRRPQAVMWERNGQVEEVALYVRALAVAQSADASVASRQLVKQLQESLGISLPGLLRLRWRIMSAPAEVPVPRLRGPSTRDRFRVVPNEETI